MSWQLVKVEKETESKCWHCGAAIKYACWISEDNADPICVGRQCCAKFMSRKEAGEIDRKISVQIDNLKSVDIARAVIGKFSDPKREAYNVYKALGGNVTLMLKEFPAQAAIMGYSF